MAWLACAPNYMMCKKVFNKRLPRSSCYSLSSRATWTSSPPPTPASCWVPCGPTCVFDIMLPTRDGYALAEAVRAADAHVPIIFLSAKALPEDVVRGFRSGGNDYLKKPFSMEELLVRIEALLNRVPRGN